MSCVGVFHVTFGGSSLGGGLSGENRQIPLVGLMENHEADDLEIGKRDQSKLQSGADGFSTIASTQLLEHVR